MVALEPHSRVELIADTANWSAGTVGTVVDSYSGGVTIEVVDDDGYTLGLFDAPIANVRAVKRTRQPA
jgi:hypothetical protein